MQRNTLFSILATAALGLVMAGPVSAKTTNWTSGDATNPAKWHEANNWSNDIPAAGDTVKIKPMSQPEGYQDPVLSTADGAAGNLTIGSGFTLTVTGVKLTLDGATQTFNGNLILSNSTAQVEFTVDVTVDGDGEIVGQHNDAEIRIANDKTLTNAMIISGKMTILDAGTSGTFHNGTTGVVLANANGVLEFADELDLTDDSTALWKSMTVGGAILRFRESAESLEGDFYLDHCASIVLLDGDDQVNITTTGDLTRDGSAVRKGTVDASGGGCFDAGNISPICGTDTQNCP